jgi:glyoxylase-like metal-dependent hydrolase (beta-lactamase superfamily II)
MPVAPSPGGVRVERVVTSGVFELDGGSWEVDNNVWLIGDDSDVLVVDAAHDAPAILEAVGGRRVVAIVCTHGHNDHVNAVGDLVRATGATASLHPDDRVLWDQTQPEPPGGELADGQVFTVGDVELTVAAHPGPRARCVLPARAGPRRAAQRRHTVQRRARCDGALVQRLPDDHRLDP